jgi:hypothetical protein
MLSEIDKEGIRVFVESNLPVCRKVGPQLTIAALVSIPLETYGDKKYQETARQHFERIKADREEAEIYVSSLLSFDDEDE